MNRPLVRPRDRKIRNRHGQLTAYAFSLGAVERHRNGAELDVDASGRYRVTVGRRRWFFDSLLEARAFMRHAGPYAEDLEARERARRIS